MIAKESLLSDIWKNILQRVAGGELTPDQALELWQHNGYEDLGFAKVDHHRVMRKGFPEVIYGQGKTAEQIAQIAKALCGKNSAVMVTRVDELKARQVQELFPNLVYHEQAKCLSLASPHQQPGRGLVGIVTAGTSDLPVAMEAALTAELMGSRVECLWDVGVAGLHRLLANQELLKTKASCLVVVAGMEGALPSVVAGLSPCPIIAVPTSVGYGASFGGLAALLGMLNSCAPGLSVVNIDNGFGAGYLAGLIDHIK